MYLPVLGHGEEEIRCAAMKSVYVVRTSVILVNLARAGVTGGERAYRSRTRAATEHKIRRGLTAQRPGGM